MTITRIVLIATVLVPSVASAQDSRSSVVLTTKHFAFTAISPPTCTMH